MLTAEEQEGRGNPRSERPVHLAWRSPIAPWADGPARKSNAKPSFTCFRCRRRGRQPVKSRILSGFSLPVSGFIRRPQFCLELLPSLVQPVRAVEKETAIGKRLFQTTHWSVVMAVRDSDPARAQQALEQLCQTYWFPLYAYARHCGYPPAEAEDIYRDSSSASSSTRLSRRPTRSAAGSDASSSPA